MVNRRTFWLILKEKGEGLIAAFLSLASFLLYFRTLAPSVACIFCDSLEFQLVTYTLGIAHPTGYPLYTLLGKLFTLIPLGDVAYRLNLTSALFGAATVGILYLALRLALGYRVPAILGASLFAVSSVFWSQALIAEVYTLNSAFFALILFLLLRWKGSVERGQEASLAPLAVVYGLSLTHHRTMLLLAPAMAVFILWVDRGLLRRWREAARLAALFVAPLLLYLYIPIRSLSAPSLVGPRVTTLQGFLDLVSGGGFSVFLTENPLAQERGWAFYFDLFRSQFGVAGLVLGVVGFFWLLRRPKVSSLLLLATAANLGFLLGYRVADIEVFFIPLFAIFACWTGGGFALLWEGAMAVGKRLALRPKVARGGYILLLVLGGLLPLSLLGANYQVVDRSREWQVHDYGVDILAQPLEEGAAIVGIMGEMTLIRYFQATEGLRPEITTIPADREEERLARLEEQLEAGCPVYLTRPLPGAEERWHLSSLGPLIRVRERPAELAIAPQVSTDVPLRDLTLLGYDIALREFHCSTKVRATLYWQLQRETGEEFWVSLRLLDGSGHLAGQIDSGPVRDSYPTAAWREGEVVIDTYDLPIFLGVPPGSYSLQLVLYRPQPLEEVGRAELGSVALPRWKALPDVSTWEVERVTDIDFGHRLRLLGYSLVGEEFKPGDALPLTFLWQAIGDLGECGLHLWLQDPMGNRWEERSSPLGGGYPTPNWERGQVVRDWEDLLLPANLPDGQYQVRFQVSEEGRPLNRSYLPGGASLKLATILVKGRERSFTVPPIEHPLNFHLGEGVKLLGYSLEPEEVAAGEALHLTLYWQALSEMDASYTVFVHLVDGEMEIWGQRDSLPGGSLLPTTSWVKGEVITDRYEVPLSGDAPPGVYTLRVGMYEATGGVRLPIYSLEGDSVGDALTLGEVRVVED